MTVGMSFDVRRSTMPVAFKRTNNDGTTTEANVVAALRCGDEATFERLVERYQNTLLRVAKAYVGSVAVAEEVVQETWLGLLESLDRFEERCSLKTWIFRILLNRAKARGVREARSLPFSAFRMVDTEDDATVDPSVFDAVRHQWTSIPHSWDGIPEERLLAEETHGQIRRAVEQLPANQQTVISLRDIAGWSSAEVCASLGISEANQRVLLHRARAKVRQALDHYFDHASV